MPDGLLAQQMGEQYESRPGQTQMARRVTQSLNEGDHLLVEAGTGTGKSLAYLLPGRMLGHGKSAARHHRHQHNCAARSAYD